MGDYQPWECSESNILSYRHFRSLWAVIWKAVDSWCGGGCVGTWPQHSTYFRTPWQTILTVKKLHRAVSRCSSAFSSSDPLIQIPCPQSHLLHCLLAHHVCHQEVVLQSQVVQIPSQWWFIVHSHVVPDDDFVSHVAWFQGQTSTTTPVQTS